ncbi:MAG: glucose-6-phosphate isomerase [Gammaproteobacteria bacterium]
MPASLLSAAPAWRQLKRRAASIAPVHLRELFRADARRFEGYSIEQAGLFLDYSKNRICAETLDLLLDLARERGVPQAIEAMFRGDPVNGTERRAALHTALRRPADDRVLVGGCDVMPEIHAVRTRMRAFVAAVHSGRHLGCGGAPITHAVHIGIGGSHLGPCMAVRALRPYRVEGIEVRFVSNIDGTDLAECLAGLDASRTLFIIASKSFTTLETMTNAESAKRWFLTETREPAAIAQHFVALSANPKATRAFGIADQNVFPLWDWVGGRYSLWSAIGLPVALSIGMDGFEALLGGAHEMDGQLRAGPWERHMAVVLALLEVWYTAFFGVQAQAVVPYDEHLALLPRYLQQLVMESNGKRVTQDGIPVDYSTAPVVWGATGTNGQHAFFQLLHQGTPLVPVDFLLPLKPRHPIGRHHEWLVANCLAQSEALMWGRTANEAANDLRRAGLDAAEVERLAPHRAFPGNRPSNTLLYESLSPETLGRLLALYEHKTFITAVLWGINPFDQYGVELGKTTATRIAACLSAKPGDEDLDGSTRGLLERYRRHLHASR